VAEGSEINGSEGDIQVTGAEGSPQLVPLFIKGGRGEGVAAAPHSAGWLCRLANRGLRRRLVQAARAV